MTEGDLKYRQPLPQLRPVSPPTQLSNGELAEVIATNQPWLSHDDVMRDVFAEQQRQRLWNGHPR